MIQSVVVTNFKGDSLELELAHPEKTGLAVHKIEGLGPPKADINYQKLATGDGGLYNSSRADTRNVVLTLAPLDNPSVEKNRIKTYRYFPLKKKVKLTFKTDVRVLYCEGYVESNEPDVFSDLETTQISVICVDPWLYAPGDSASVFSGVTPMFEFPFSNESLTDNLIEFGDIMVDTRARLIYEGDIDAGVEINVHALDGAEDIKLFNVDTREKMIIDTGVIATKTGKPFGYADDIFISTRPGNRYVKLLRDGVYTDIISALDRDSDWLMLTTGDNVFGFDARIGANNLWVTYSYRNTYGGV